MKSKRSLASGDDTTEINISPLIDMVFILLIFFIVTTVFVEEDGVGVDKPQPNPAQLLEDKGVSLRITNTGQVLYEGREIGVAGVRALVRQRMAQLRDDKRVVILQLDDAAAAGVVVRVIDEVQQAEARVSLTPAS
jgi:biopolymer transport protein ExbD